MIFCQISSTKSLSNRMEISLENLNLDIWAKRVEMHLTMFLNNCLILCLQIKSQWKETPPMHCCFHFGTDFTSWFSKAVNLHKHNLKLAGDCALGKVFCN